MQVQLIFVVLVAFLGVSGACDCGCGKHKRSYLPPPNALLSALGPKVAMAQYPPGLVPKSSSPLSLKYNFDSSSKSLQNQGTSSSSAYSSSSLPEMAPSGFAAPASKLSQLISLKMALKSQKDAINRMEQQLAVQLAEATRQQYSAADPFGTDQQKPVVEEKPTQNFGGLGYPAANVAAPPYPGNSAFPTLPRSYPAYPTAFGAPTNDMFSAGQKQMEENNALPLQNNNFPSTRQESAAPIIPGVPSVMANAFAAPYAGYSTSAASNSASSGYSGGSTSTSLGYQTAMT